MVLQYVFNAEAPAIANIRELHVDFDRNILRLVVEDQQLVNIDRELDTLNFPNESLILTISDIVNPF